MHMRIVNNNSTIGLVTIMSLGMLAGCASAGASDQASEDGDGATVITNCGLELQISNSPERAIAMEQGATEIMLALGLQDRMIGTSYLTDQVADEYAEAYAGIPVLADQYPTAEEVRAAEPDFVYSMRASAFAAEAAGAREELISLGVPAYLSANDCEDPSLTVSEPGFEQVFAEITEIATAFEVTGRAEEIIAEQQAVLDHVRDQAADVGNPSIVWLYSTVNGAPVVAGGAGLPETLGRLAGGTNAFSDLDSQWTEVSWDQIAQRDPDVIVVAHLSRGLDGDSADDKIDLLRTDAVTAELTAVQEDRLVSLPATELDPSVRSINALQTLSEKLVELGEMG